ncbi:uncharacterized protein [Chironomus tepperi]|uniref:uncharacterized protein n=1 Tax=Chironomus tepperi TaxID=113505 RepID=UPI00391F6756
MAKRPAGSLLPNQSGTSKKQKNFDPYQLIESLEKLSLSVSLTHIASISLSSNSSSRFSEVRNERDNNLIKWHQIPRVKDNYLLDLNMAIENLKITLLKLHCCNTDDVDISQLFSTILKILLRLEFRVHCGRYTNIEYFVKREFPYKQAEMFSEQYHINLDMKKSNSYITSRETMLLNDDPICYDEKYIQARQIIECISQIASASKQFSEMMLTEKLDVDLSQTMASINDKKTMIDLVSVIAKSIIKDNRYIAKNFGLVVALTHLLQSLTSHYNEYSDIDDIDNGLETMFLLVLQLATFDVEIMLSLSESFVNITHKNPNRMTLFKSMCVSYPHTNLEYSCNFKLMRMDLCPGCKFQIFFLLLNHVFRFYEAEKITGERLDALFKITQNMNYLVFILLANDVDIKFLVPYKGYSRRVDDACNCYRFLLYCTLILNDILFKNQNSNPNNYDKMCSIRKDSIIILNCLLNYSYDSPDFWKINPILLMMNEIYATINFVNLDCFNDSRTRLLQDKAKIFELYILNNPQKPAAPMNPFKLFLKKFDPENAKYSVVVPDDDDDMNNNRRSSKALKYPTVKMSKEDLLKELDDDFKADECITFSVEHFKKDIK